MTQDTILFVIDDDLDLAESLQMVFEMKGYTVRIFGNVESGLAAFKSGVVPETIIIDGNLPEMSGPVGITAFRESGYSGSFVGMSGEDYGVKMLSAGASVFWSKPFEMVDFIASVKQAGIC